VTSRVSVPFSILNSLEHDVCSIYIAKMLKSIYVILGSRKTMPDRSHSTENGSTVTYLVLNCTSHVLFTICRVQNMEYIASAFVFLVEDSYSVVSLLPVRVELCRV
jgi:hypothetical protein